MPGSDLTLDLIGNGNRERFLLDLWRGTFKLSKIKYQTRGEGSEAYAFLNDQDHSVGGDVMEALENYEVIPALWSERTKHINTLAG